MPETLTARVFGIRVFVCIVYRVRIRPVERPIMELCFQAERDE